MKNHEANKWTLQKKKKKKKGCLECDQSPTLVRLDKKEDGKYTSMGQLELNILQGKDHESI